MIYSFSGRKSISTSQILIYLIFEITAEALREQGVAHVVYWDKALTPCPKALHVTQFSHAFFATLRNKSATIPEVTGCCPLQHFFPDWSSVLLSTTSDCAVAFRLLPWPCIPGTLTADQTQDQCCALHGCQSWCLTLNLCCPA